MLLLLTFLHNDLLLVNAIIAVTVNANRYNCYYYYCFIFVKLINTMSIRRETVKIVINRKDFTADELKYFDVDRSNETLTRFTFPANTQANGQLLQETQETQVSSINMSELDYATIAAILQQQYRLPVKYLEPDYDNCYYICQKSLLPNADSKVSDAFISIEPNNQNVFKQISYTPINQALEIGTIVTLHEAIPYDAPARKLLTSASLKCEKPLCNRCIPYTTIDVGSEIVGKFVVKIATPLRNSMALYRFRRPQDNILEFVTADYLNINIDNILKYTKAAIEKHCKQPTLIPAINKRIDEMLSLSST